MKKKKILLLNPPAEKLVIRDYYCSKISKGYYYTQPVDLLMQSGILSEKYEVLLIDAVVDSIDAEKCLGIALSMDVDGVIALIGAANFEQDCKFIQKLFESYAKQNNKFLPIVLSGDNLLEDPVSYLKKLEFASAVLTNFTSDSTVSFFSCNFSNLRDIAYRKYDSSGFKGDEIIYNSSIKRFNDIKIPMPRHDLFIKKSYRYPHMTGKPLATVLTEYGCPFRCTFCIMSTLGASYRSVEDVIEELKYLEKLGTKYIYFSDQTFGSDKKRTKLLLNKMSQHNFSFKWCCFSRVNAMDPETLSLMKAAGCHTIMFGVESGNPEILKIYKKDYTLDQVRTSFKVAKELNILRMGTFLLGLPEEDEESIKKTLNLMKDLDCDYISINVAVPRKNTELRKKAIDENLITSTVEFMDQSGQTVAMPSKSLSKEKLQYYKRKALIGFYLRPSYLIKRLLLIRSFTQLKIHILEAINMFTNAFKKE